MLSRYTLPTRPPAERVFRYFSSLGQAVFWLDSGEHSTTGKSYLGVSSEVHSCQAGQEREFLELLRAELGGTEHRNIASGAERAEGAFAEPHFSLGWVGWFAYEFGVSLLGLQPAYEAELPAAMMMRVRVAVEYDHESGEVTVLAESDAELHRWLGEHHEAFSTVDDSLPAPDRSASTLTVDEHSNVIWRDEPHSYLSKITRCQEAIARGDAYLLCLTTQAEVNTVEPPAEVYLRLRRSSPSHHGGYVSAEGVTLVSASPERFLAVNGAGIAQTKPIKGTRPRGASEEEDRALAVQLATDDKELAENLMIVDLMRNDFSSVCQVGTVRVTDLHAVESYPQVHQLVSTVTGRLSAEYDALDLLAACFPAGSMTGTPKRSAVQLLLALEQAPRGVYSGCFGYFSRDGSADLAMVIRSIVFCGSTASIGTGGGITSNSVPTAELEETRLKASALLAALNPGA